MIPLGPCRYRFPAASSTDRRRGGEWSAVNGNEFSDGAVYVVASLAVVAVSLAVLVAACTPLVFRRRRGYKDASAAAAAVGKPGVPVIFVDELDGQPRAIEGDSDDEEEPVMATLPPEYGAAAAAGDYKLLASSESSDNDDEELSREHQLTDSLRRRDDDSQLQQQQQSSLASYSGPPSPPQPTPVSAERR